MVTTGYAGSKLAVARFETAPGPRDGDADGVLDDADGCPLVHAVVIGCPIIERSVSLHARSTQGQLAGTLASDDQACVGREFIRVLRVRRASEKQVAKVRVRHSGVWLAGGFAPGRYRAVVRSKVRPRLGLCEADESRIDRIPR
jgi:hypothetical protein